jgi:hypothetical protein
MEHIGDVSSLALRPHPTSCVVGFSVQQAGPVLPLLPTKTLHERFRAALDAQTRSQTSSDVDKAANGPNAPAKKRRPPAKTHRVPNVWRQRHNKRITPSLRNKRLVNEDVYFLLVEYPLIPACSLACTLCCVPTHTFVAVSLVRLSSNVDLLPYTRCYFTQGSQQPRLVLGHSALHSLEGLEMYAVREGYETTHAEGPPDKLYRG